MPTHARLALLAVPLLVAGTVAGVLFAGGALDDAPFVGTADAASDERCSVADFAFPDDASAETWEGDVPADAEGGTVEVHGYDGGVDVATWDQDAWKVEVAEEDARDVLEPQVEGSVTDGVFSLSVTVEDTSRREVGPVTTSVSVGDQPRAHVRVLVPDRGYEEVAAHDQPTDNESVDLDVTLDVPEVPDDPTNPGNASDEPPVQAQGLEAGSLLVEARDRDVAASGIDADDVSVASRDGEAVVTDVEASSLHVVSRDGDACAQEADAAEATVATRDGDAVGQVRAADLEATSRDGDVVVGFAPTASGELTATSRDGDVSVDVLTGDEIGYDVSAETRDGDVSVDLPNATTVTDDEDDGATVTARTQDYDSRTKQVDLTAESRDGDVAVTGS
jgi:hypothetical protein